MSFGAIFKPWLWVIVSAALAGWQVSVGDAPGAAIFSGISAFLASAIMGRRIWCIDDNTAKKRWVEYFGRGSGEEVATARFIAWVFSLVSFGFLVSFLTYLVDPYVWLGLSDGLHAAESFPLYRLLGFIVFGIAAASFLQRLLWLQRKRDPQ